MSMTARERADLDRHLSASDEALIEGGEEAEPQRPALVWVAVYLADRAYGGPEEGGWWYECGALVDLSTYQAAGVLPRAFFPEQEMEARAYATEVQAKLDATVNVGRRSVSSVLSEGVYEARITEGDAPLAGFPAERPHYE